MEKIHHKNAHCFYFLFNNFFALVNKSNVFNIFKLLGILCVVICISSFNLSSPYKGIVTYIGSFYAIYNFLTFLLILLVCLIVILAYFLMRLISITSLIVYFLRYLLL